MSRPGAGGGRWVDVPPERVARWVDNFRSRHGDFAVTGGEDGTLVIRAYDGTVADLHHAPGARTANDLDGFVAAALAPYRIGLVLARKAAVAVGVAEGSDLVTHKVDTSYVQSRTAAGGWSQQRFARRRSNQAKAAAEDAAGHVLRLVVPQAGSLVTVVTGGDRRTVAAILSDRRLAPLEPLIADRFLDVPEPRFAVLADAVSAARAVAIRITDPEQHE